ncbi:uncharacterized protein LOC134378904 [Cynocephalus volans]|uniref:uncharacterized protein LOC134378904 n=1 Tax=Cynocephalus volans TaxID=110931 RepID=UPI002FC9322F
MSVGKGHTIPAPCPAPGTPRACRHFLRDLEPGLGGRTRLSVCADFRESGSGTWEVSSSYFSCRCRPGEVSCLDSGKRATQKDTSSLVPLHWFGFSCAALIASGGIIGYAKAGPAHTQFQPLVHRAWFKDGRSFPFLDGSALFPPQMEKSYLLEERGMGWEDSGFSGMGLEDLAKIFESFPTNVSLCPILEGRKWSFKMTSTAFKYSHRPWAFCLQCLMDNTALHTKFRVKKTNEMK